MSDLQDTLLKEFQRIQGPIARSAEGWRVNGGGASGGGTNTAPSGNVDALGDQTGAIDYGRAASSGSGSSGGGFGGIGAALAAGLGIVPLGLELASLFEGGSSTPPPLTRYAMPESIGFVGSTDGVGALTHADFGQGGVPRTYDGTASQYSVSTVPAASGPADGSGSGSQPIQITVHAMDAQSFMDHSDEIASAVNKAIRSLHPLSDTIANL